MPGLLRGIARTAVVAGTATAVSGRVQRRQQGRWAAQEQQAAAQAQQAYAQQQPVYAQDEPAYAPAPASTSKAEATDNRLAQLKELGALREAGVLTDAEFEAQKRRILYE
ncbi:MAG: SHOCT domain-containing protein [Propionibacteriaceae bacterium]